jgi:acetoin utilization protein AcuB
MLVKDVMTKNPVTITPETSVTEAKALMTKQKINKLPVLDKSGALVGILTKNDLIKATPSDATTLDMYELSYLLSKLTVEKVMHKDVKTVVETETVEEAARLMADYSIGCLPVMKGDLITGIITETDLFHAFIDMFGARHAGVRATFVLDEKPGQLSRVCKAIADLNGNLVSVVTSDGVDEAHRNLTVKATVVTIDQLKQIITDCGGKIEDIRQV